MVYNATSIRQPNGGTIKMMYLFHCRKDGDEILGIEPYECAIPIEADNMDLAWGVFNTFYDGEYDHVSLQVPDN